MAGILVGTSGYSYADWVGPVYPTGTRPERYLELYAGLFDFVELNFSFYRQPEAPKLERIRDRVPSGFRFAAKVHRSITHEPAEDLDDAVRRFIEGTRPLRESGQLVAVLAQFPYAFHYQDATRRHLHRVCRLFEGLPLAVEFRNRDWHTDRVYGELGRRGVSLVSVDLPPLAGLPPSELLTTAPMAYLRFHGRNEKTWWNGDNTSRYDYRYGDAELAEWARRALGALERLSLLVAAFNNHYRGQAVDNARQFRALVADAAASPEAPRGTEPATPAAPGTPGADPPD